MKNNTLSVVLATFNEEKNLGSCLESVKDFADEVVIVDGTSTDKTVEIAKKYNAKVIVKDNPKNFHINKQKAIETATKDWILQLDADEQVTEKSKKEIEKVINSPEAKNGYWIPRKNWFIGRYLMKGGVYPDYTLRLYRNGKGRLPMKDVHEQAIVEGEVGYLQEPLLHNDTPTFSRYLMRWNRYTDLIASDLKHQQAGILIGINYLIFKPIGSFLWTYLRHKGFQDSWQGFVFHFFSALRFPVSYIKYLRRK